jgi:hypothetical protein
MNIGTVEDQGTWAHQQRKRDERQRDKRQNQREAACVKRSREGRLEKSEEGEDKEEKAYEAFIPRRREDKERS